MVGFAFVLVKGEIKLLDLFDAITRNDLMINLRFSSNS